ncbi:MAG: glutamate-5-semialdehyde dehydrogenase, partial [Abditibacteriales bacterium]|nr:glutamate-5-semialdehyde dehydrogenase [Abditibacteriales bacterium]
MMSPQEQVEQKARQAREAARQLSKISTAVKNAALEAMAHALIERQGYILECNQEDVKRAREKKLSEAMIDRLLLDESRLEGMAKGLREVADLPDPVGQVVKGWQRPNGLKIQQVRVPLGVIAFIYESRPNVTVDAAGLCLKSGNAIILRGGSEALRSNVAITHVITTAAEDEGIPPHAIQVIDTPDRAAVQHLMTLNQYVDVLIPRGGKSLIQAVTEHATMPVLYHGEGICHVYVDDDADLPMASNIVFNAKVQRPSVCNAMETLLVAEKIAPTFLPLISERLMNAKVELRGDERARAIVPAMKPATDEDWDTEYLALILSIKVVKDVDEAIEHINRHGSQLSDAIVTNNFAHAQKFLDEVDSASVYVNASTRFTDGGEFGLGAEIGISTQKLHARGPMGLQELTTTKYVVEGDGQVR